MTRVIMKTEDYVDFYSDLSQMILTKHIEDVYNDDPYETQKNGDITIKSKYEDIWLEIVDDVCETIDKFIIKGEIWLE